ncbi:MAG: response regulator [Parvibaculum sp.]|uniref:response regulator n=1 Tax=Parvibaculum sp. TaxID=2024848 RepID=UPI00284B95D0|nr:response regulator [Parvibaculum sp.]MDR3498851.1 response regulator [Parvibaculum sp.]
MSATKVDETATLTELGPEQLRVLNTLIIVDNLPMLGIFRNVLNELGIQNVRHGKTAQEVVSILMSEPIDLIVIDDLAPLDGVKFLNTLRRGNTKLPNAVPVMFVTAVAERDRIIAARDAGANEIMLKPFSAAQLKARLEKTVKRPREFVEAKAYVGPDRRRRDGDTPVPGEDRRRR